MWEYLNSLAILAGSGYYTFFSLLHLHLNATVSYSTLHTLRFNMKWLRLLSDEFCLKSVAQAMQSAIVPKQLAKNVTLILYPWFQVVCGASISAFFSCQWIHCGFSVPAVSCSYYMQTQSLAGKINSEKQLLCTDSCTHSQAGTALFLSLLAPVVFILILLLQFFI